MRASSSGVGPLFFVEASMTGSGLTHVKWALENGIDAWFVTADPGKYLPLPYGALVPELQQRRRIVVVDATRREQPPEEVVDAATAVKGPAGIVCVTDHDLPFAALLASEIGASFLSVKAIALLRDKRRARALYDDLGLPSARWCAPKDLPDVEQFAREIQGPIVIKNCKGTASLDVRFCIDGLHAARDFGAMSASPRFLNGDLMLEEYLLGPVASLEVLVMDGDPIALGITDRQLGPLPYFCELSYTFPSVFPDEVGQSMLRTASALVAALQMRQGFLHIEFAITNEGPKLIEVNARLAGGLIPNMMTDCLTIPVSELVCRSALGILTERPAQNGQVSSGAKVYPRSPGRLRSFKPLSRARGIPWVREVIPLAAIGDEILPPRDTRGAVCQVRTLASSQALAFNTAQMAAQLAAAEVEDWLEA